MNNGERKGYTDKGAGKERSESGDLKSRVNGVV